MSVFILYNMGMVLVLLVMGPLLLVWACFVPKLRAGFWQKLGQHPFVVKQSIQNLPPKNRIWLHAVSVGELNAARPLITALRQKGLPLILSCTTQTGYALAQKTYPKLPVLYFPYDLPWVVSRTLQWLKPQVVLMMETEIWPNFSFLAYRCRIPLLMVSGRISDASWKGYQQVIPFLTWVFRHYAFCLMQTQQDRERLIALGASPCQVHVVGNIKFDRQMTVSPTVVEDFKNAWGVSSQTPILVFASTHAGEEDLLTGVFQKLKSQFSSLKMILAPRHPERVKQVEHVLKQHGVSYRLRSQLQPSWSKSGVGVSTAALPPFDCLVLGTIGELQTVYMFSSVAVMGGSFVPVGGHNPIEPLYAKVPVVFGPHMQNFKDITQMICEAQAGIQVANTQALLEVLQQLLKEPWTVQQMVEKGQHLLESQAGITSRVMNFVENILERS